MSIYDYQVKDAKGELVEIKDFKGQVLLIVNTASACGFTGQYDGLESLQSELSDEGFSVLGFPCNQFGKQETGSDDEIQSFCQMKFNIKFPVYQKIDVNGNDALPLFNYLKEQAPGILGSKRIKWNFTKFLVDRDGRVIKRFAPKTEPAEIKSEIVELLKA